MEKIEKKCLAKRIRDKVLYDTRGEFGIKQIAATVAVIVIIGAVMTTIQNDFLRGWIESVWTFLWTKIQEFAG